MGWALKVKAKVNKRSGRGRGEVSGVGYALFHSLWKGNRRHRKLEPTGLLNTPKLGLLSYLGITLDIRDDCLLKSLRKALFGEGSIAE